MTTNNSMYKDFIKAQKEFEPVRKTSKNAFLGYNYADISTCFDAVMDSLHNNNFSLIQKTHACDNGVTVETVFIHISGESISGGLLNFPAVSKNKIDSKRPELGFAEADAQAYGSALTYARRYSLMAACGITPCDDDGAQACQQFNKNTNKQPVNKPILQQKIDNMKQAQAKLKSKEELILEAEKAASMGTESFRTWWKGNITHEEKEILKDKVEHFQNKCKEADEMNQDIGV